MTAPWDRREPREQRRVENLLLRDWLPAAVTFSPYWAERAAAIEAAAAALTTREDLRRLVPSRERDVAGAGGVGSPALLMRPTEEQLKARASTGLLMSVARAIGREGSRGKRRQMLEEYKPIHLHRGGVATDLAIASTRSDLDRLHRAGARGAAVLGLDEDDYLVSAVPAGPTSAFWGVYHLALGSSMLAVHPRTGEGLDEVVEAFPLVPATAVAVPVGDAKALAAALVEADVDCGEVRTVVTVGPPPPRDRRASIADAWAVAADRDVVVRALWAPRQARAPWAECAPGIHGLHTYPDMEVLEVVDPVTAEPSDDEGDLTLTSAGWHGTALLRFQTGVYVEGTATDPCPGCGRTVPRITGEPVPRAWQLDVAVGPGEDAVADLRGAASVLQTTTGVSAWRVEVRAAEPADEIRVEVADGPPDGDELTERLAAAMGVWPTVVDTDVPAAHVRTRVAETGSVFADRR